MHAHPAQSVNVVQMISEIKSCILYCHTRKFDEIEMCFSGLLAIFTQMYVMGILYWRLGFLSGNRLRYFPLSNGHCAIATVGFTCPVYVRGHFFFMLTTFHRAMGTVQSWELVLIAQCVDGQFFEKWGRGQMNKRVGFIVNGCFTPLPPWKYKQFFLQSKRNSTFQFILINEPNGLICKSCLVHLPHPHPFNQNELNCWIRTGKENQLGLWWHNECSEHNCWVPQTFWSVKSCFTKSEGKRIQFATQRPGGGGGVWSPRTKESNFLSLKVRNVIVQMVSERSLKKKNMYVCLLLVM